MMDVYYAGIDVSARTLDSALALPDMPSGNTQANWSQNTQANWSHFGLKNNVRNGRLSTDLAVAPSAHFFP